MNVGCFNLSLEQEFHIKAVEISNEQLTPEELQSALAELTRQLMIKENIIRHLVKDQFFPGMA